MNYIIMKKYSLPFLAIILLFSCMGGSEQPSGVEVSEMSRDTASAQDIHLVHDVPAYAADNLVNVIVEVPTGTLEKWEVSKTTGQLFLEQKDGQGRRINYLAFPANYGMIPQTLLSEANGGDGDPLDVIVLGEALEQGSIVPCRLIGVIEMRDKGEQDDKLIAVRTEGNFAHVRDTDQLIEEFPGIDDILTIWFNNYKRDKVEVLAISDADRALSILQAAVQDYQLAKAE